MNHQAIGGIDAEAEDPVGRTRPDTGRHSDDWPFERGRIDF